MAIKFRNIVPQTLKIKLLTYSQVCLLFDVYEVPRCGKILAKYLQSRPINRYTINRYAFFGDFEERPKNRNDLKIHI